MTLAPWQLEGIDPEMRERAREAARRAGLSVGQWLSSVIRDQAADEDLARGAEVLPRRRDDLATVNARLDDLSRQLDRLSVNGRDPRSQRDGSSPSAVAASRQRNGRADQVAPEGRAAHRDEAPSWSAGADTESSSLDEAVAAIAARQRALYTELGAPAFAGPRPSSSASPRCAADTAVAGLRNELAEIGRALSDAMPRRAIEALEAEVRALVRRIDAGRAAGTDASAFAGIETGLRDIRDALRGLAPAESLVGFDGAVKTLESKVDRMAAGREDPAGLRQLQAEIASMRTVVGQVASGEALAALAREVRDLAAKIERGEASAQPVPSELAQQLDQLVRSLNERMEHVGAAHGEQLSRGEQLAFGGLEDRIARLVEKLDASEGRLGHLEMVERGMAELLVHLESLRALRADAGTRAGFEPTDAMGASLTPRDEEVATLKEAHARAERHTEGSFEEVHGTIDTVVDRVSVIETNFRKDQRSDDENVTELPPAPMPAPGAPFAPAAAALPPARPEPAPSVSPRSSPRSTQSRPAAVALPPLDPNLPPDYPLEPGSGPPRARPAASGTVTPSASAAERIAASEGPLRAARDAAVEPDSKLNYLQAARRAAQFAAQNAQRSEIATALGDPAGADGNPAQRLKAIFVGISVVILVAVALRFAVTYWQSADLVLPAAPAFAERQAPKAGDTATKDAALTPEQAPPPSTSLETPAAAPLDLVPTVTPPPPLPRTAPAAGVLGADQPTSSPPAAPQPSAPAARTGVGNDVTGSIQPTAPSHQAPPVAPTQSVDRLPPAIGGTRLVTAAQAGEPAAAYEVATRYAEGRGVPQNLAAAAVWYERAARGGLPPAMFRLGALYEKGNGVTKNLKEARRYYLAAADRGNANAMHNLGVLYAEGIDGKPDFASAAQWFRKSAMFGIADSQYNLAVLYARGIGVERSMAEAFRWFALAARSGDAEAGKKRDEIATALDQKTLAAMRHTVDTWAADRPAEDAATVAAPPGGWDQAEPGPKQGPDPRASAKSRSAPS